MAGRFARDRGSQTRDRKEMDSVKFERGLREEAPGVGVLAVLEFGWGRFLVRVVEGKKFLGMTTHC